MRSCYRLNRNRLFACLIAIAFASMFIVPLVNGQCYTCSDTGKIVCNNCQGSGKIPTSEPIETCEYCRGLGFVQATISKKSAFAVLGPRVVYVSGTFENDQAVGVYGIAVAEVMSETATFSSESERNYFPPNEEILITIIIGDIPTDDFNWISQFGNLETNIYLSETDPLVCPLCDGNVLVAPQITCSICGGTGFVDCPDCNTNLVASGGEGVTLIGVVAIVGLVIVGTVLLKRKKTSESDLRKTSFYDFQNWVIQKVLGEASSIRDSHVGIDGYTQDGDPIEIRQSDSIGKAEVYKFANALSKKKFRRGIIVAFSFNEDVVDGIIGAKQTYRLGIKTITIKELIERKNLRI